MAVTETGFKRLTYDEILEGKIATAKNLFGEDIDTSELTPLGKFIRINAYDQALTEEEAEAIYYSIFPNTAVGVSLDRLCVFAGISRNEATKAEFIVTLTGKAGTVVPAGFLVATESGINYSVEQDSVIGEDGTVDVIAVCEESGEIGNVTAQEITIQVNPIAEVDTVLGKSISLKGEETESDYALRSRFSQAIEGAGSCNVAAIKAALLRVPTVTHAGVIVNETDTTDEAGRPPRSFECYVRGGENYHYAIAEAIFEKKPIGIKTYGTVSQEVTDEGGGVHTIKFSHTAFVSVCVRISITTSAAFEGDTGKQEIKSNLDNYVDNLGIGNPLVFSALYGQIHSVAGVTEVTDMKVSTDGGDWFVGNIQPQSDENCVLYQLEISENGGEYEVV